MEGKQRIFYSEMKEYAIQIHTNVSNKLTGVKVFRYSPALCVSRLDQYQQILQVHKEPSTQICFKKKKKVSQGPSVILRLFLCISDDQHLAGLSKTFHNISAMGFSLELHNYSILQPTMGSIQEYSSGADKDDTAPRVP